MRSTVVLIRVVLATLIVAALGVTGSAQMTHRLKGFLRTETGAPVANASIRADALSGFRGEPLAGVKEFTVATGEWNLLGIHAGLWMFSAKAPGMLLWDARDLAPKDLRQPLAAAIDDLRGISRVQ